MDDKITINKKELASFVKRGKDLVFTSTAEDSLVKLLEAYDYIKGQIEEVKTEIQKSGRKALGSGFKGIVGEHIKVVSRAYGDKYAIADRSKVYENFMKETVSYRPDTDTIEEYILDHGSLPDGIEENVREEKLTITRI